ncbi:hypothetical protein [Bradyrhizobium sp. cf659]|uniref:hypothetical protein n=1 Tax=Bradyrhizobium sp. cf659 TaxID=1761771 RepID=UPI001160412D|nr:hypothetical protein [Bradyrhizobium sp. cf659]
MRNGDVPGIVYANPPFRSRAMANKPKLKVRIPFLLEAAAEGHLAIVLLFALALTTITLIGAWR